jgi:hypothetical protein
MRTKKELNKVIDLFLLKKTIVYKNMNDEQKRQLSILCKLYSRVQELRK